MRLFITIIILCVFSCSVEKRELPIYGRSEIIETNNDGIISFDTINHTIKAFKFYNQDSILIDNNTLIIQSISQISFLLLVRQFAQ